MSFRAVWMVKKNKIIEYLFLEIVVDFIMVCKCGLRFRTGICKKNVRICKNVLWAREKLFV